MKGDTELTTDGKKSFARSVSVTVSLIDELDIITDLNIPGKSKLKKNDSEKFCGRTFNNNRYWFGIRDFSNCKLCLGILELYNYYKRPIQSKLDELGLKYEIVDTPIDKGHWYYISFESICCFKYENNTRKEEIEALINELMTN